MLSCVEQNDVFSFLIGKYASNVQCMEERQPQTVCGIECTTTKVFCGWSLREFIAFDAISTRLTIEAFDYIIFGMNRINHSIDEQVSTEWKRGKKACHSVALNTSIEIDVENDSK
jgi:hypothetical protein